MALRRVQLPSEVSGQLWLGPMPGRFQSLSELSAIFLAMASSARHLSTSMRV